MNKHKTFFLFLLSLGTSMLTKAQSPEEVVDKYLDMLQQEYSGEKALETTAYVAQFWRQAGNPGFDSSIYAVQQILEDAGYQKLDDKQSKDRALSYRIERYPLRIPSWEPTSAQLSFIDSSEPILDYRSNRNMVAINSFSTEPEGVEAEVVYLKECTVEALEALDVQGKNRIGRVSSLSIIQNGD